MAALNMKKYNEGMKAAAGAGTIKEIVESFPALNQPWPSDKQEQDQFSYVVGFGDGVLALLRRA